MIFPVPAIDLERLWLGSRNSRSYAAIRVVAAILDAVADLTKRDARYRRFGMPKDLFSPRKIGIAYTRRALVLLCERAKAYRDSAGDAAPKEIARETEGRDAGFPDGSGGGL